MGGSRDKHRAAKDFIRNWCDKQRLTVDDVDWASASDPGRQYNCFGFVMDKRINGKLRWWQPKDKIDGLVTNPTDYWPNGIPEDTTIGSYISAAMTEGFVPSVDAAWEEGFETIALYYTPSNNEFQHAARQKSPGVWESKLGNYSDIEHPSDGIDNIWYGTGRIYMKRPWPHPEPLPLRRIAITDKPT
jgi:hypothetical protein